MHGGHGHHASTSLVRTAASATLHCLTGCAIGEVLGMVIGTGLDLSNTVTIVLAILLAFLFGYALTTIPLVRSGLGLAAVLPLALASDTISIAVMEVVDNLTIVAIPGAMDASLGDGLFWGTLAFALAIAFAVAWPVNIWLIGRGAGHAVVHGMHGGGHAEVPALNVRRLVMTGAVAIAATVAIGVVGAQIAEREDGGSPHSAAFDRAFIDAMVPHHRAAIEMAMMARGGLTEPVLRRIADDIVSTQQGEIDRMLAWRESWYGSRRLSGGAGDELGMSDDEMGMSHDPHALHMSDDVDAAFAEMMIDHHQGAVEMAQMALRDAEHDALRALAGRIIAAQEREIALMRPLARNG